MSEKYYTPSIEDIHVGYECEIDGGENLNISQWFSHVMTKEDFRHLYLGDVRTPYLNKEQIEAEGWEYVVTDPKGTLVFSKDHLVVGLFPETHRIQFQNKMLKDNEIMSITCPSINEFRKIVKWIYTK